MTYSSWYKPNYSWEIYQSQFTPVETNNLFDFSKATQWYNEEIDKLSDHLTQYWEWETSMAWNFYEGVWLAWQLITAPLSGLFSWFMQDDNTTPYQKQGWLFQATWKVFWAISDTVWKWAEYLPWWTPQSKNIFWRTAFDTATWLAGWVVVSQVKKIKAIKSIKLTTKADTLNIIDNTLKEEAWIFGSKIDTSSTIKTIDDYLTKVETTPIYTNPFKVIDDLHNQWITNLDEPIKNFIDNANNIKTKVETTKAIFKTLWDEIWKVDKNWIPILKRNKVTPQIETKISEVVESIIPKNWEFYKPSEFRSKITDWLPMLDEIITLNKNQLWDIIADDRYNAVIQNLMEKYPVEIQVVPAKYYMNLVQEISDRATKYKKAMSAYEKVMELINTWDINWANILLKKLNPNSPIIKEIDNLSKLKIKERELIQPWIKVKTQVEINNKLEALKETIKWYTPDQILDYSKRARDKFSEAYKEEMKKSYLYNKNVTADVEWMYQYDRNLITLFTSNDNLKVILHEFSHHLEKYITPEVYTKISEIYTKEFTDLVNKYWKTPIEKEIVWKILRREDVNITDYTKWKPFSEAMDITSFYDNTNRLLADNDLYRYLNVSEFIAEELREAFIRGQQKKWIIQKIVDFLKWLFIKTKKDLFDKEAHSFLSGKTREVIDESRLSNESYFKKMKWDLKEEDFKTKKSKDYVKENEILKIKVDTLKSQLKRFTKEGSEKLKLVRKQLNDKIIQERLRQKDYKNLKYSILQSFHIEVVNWNLHKKILPLLYKLSKSSEFIKANSLQSINDIFRKYEPEIKALDFNLVYDDITKETDDYINLTKRQTSWLLTIWARQKIAEIINLLEDSKNELDWVKLREVQDYVKRTIQEWKIEMKKYKQSILDEVNSMTAESKVKWIKKEITYQDIDWRNDTPKEKLVKMYKTFSSYVNPKFRPIWNMFWKDSKIYKFLVYTGWLLEQTKEHRMLQEVTPVMKTIHEIFKWDKKAMRVLSIWLFSTKEIWFKKLIHSNQLIKDLFYDNWKSLKRTTTIDKEIQSQFDYDLLNKELEYIDDNWKPYKIKVKDSILMEEIERYYTEPIYKEVTNIWKWLFNKLYIETSWVLERTEWTILKKDDNYIPYLINKSHRPKEITFKWEEMYTEQTPQAYFTKEKVDTWTHSIDYEFDPLIILERAWADMLHYIHLKEHFTKMKLLFKWKMTKINNLSDKELDDYINNKGYELTDNLWNKITIQERLPNWNMIIEWREFWFKALKEVTSKELYIRHPSEWIINSVWEWWKRILNELLEEVSWNTPYAWDLMNNLSRALKQIASVPLLFNPSATTKQLLSVFDAAPYLWFNNILDNGTYLTKNLDVRNWLSENVWAISQRAWQQIWLVDELWMKTFEWWKAHEIYSKYRNIWLTPIKWLDKEVYEAVWFTAYKKSLTDRWLIFKPFEKLDDIAVSEATDLTERLMYTSSRFMQPMIMKNPIMRSIFSLTMPQINRYYQFVEEFWDRYWRWEIYSTAKLTLGYATSNFLDSMITISIWYLLYQLWFSNNQEYKDVSVIHDKIYSANIIYNMTLNQNPLVSKATSMYTYWNLSIFQWMYDNNKKALSKLVKWENQYWWKADRINWLIDFVNQTFIWTPWKYIKEEAIRLWLLDK